MTLVGTMIPLQDTVMHDVQTLLQWLLVNCSLCLVDRKSSCAGRGRRFVLTWCRDSRRGFASPMNE